MNKTYLYKELKKPMVGKQLNLPKRKIHAVMSRICNVEIL